MAARRLPRLTALTPGRAAGQVAAAVYGYEMVRAPGPHGLIEQTGADRWGWASACRSRRIPADAHCVLDVCWIGRSDLPYSWLSILGNTAK